MADTPYNQPTPEMSEPRPIEPKGYSSFFPVFAVFVVLAISYGFYLGGDFNERAQIRRAEAELAPVIPQAQRVLKIADDLSKDLVTLANANDPEAAKIVAEFNIRTNRAAAPATAPAPGTGTAH